MLPGAAELGRGGERGVINVLDRFTNILLVLALKFNPQLVPSIKAESSGTFAQEAEFVSHIWCLANIVIYKYD